MCARQLPRQSVPVCITMLSCFRTLNVCTATSRPTCPRTHQNAIQFWYLKCLHGNSQGQPVPIRITMLSCFGTLNVCTAITKAKCPCMHHNAVLLSYLKCLHSNFQANVS